MHAFGADKGLLLQLVAVRVTEHNAGQRGTAAGVVDDCGRQQQHSREGKLPRTQGTLEKVWR